MSGGPEKPDPNYEIGYARPPKACRFKSGESGNPAGRPKRKPSKVSTVQEALSELVRVKENGRWRYLSARQVILCRLRNEAMRGHLPSTKYLLGLLPKDENPEYDLSLLSDEELEQLQQLIIKMQRS